MLCQFTVKNYKSLRDETTFDMQATKISEHQDTLITTIDGQQLPWCIIRIDIII